mgnify:CR=1 FL=1
MQLVIAEKPSVAKSIADVLGALDRQDGYFEGGGYLVSWCVGHLIELAEPESYGDQWKKWTFESLPVNPEHWQYEIKEDTKEQYDVLYGLLHDSRVDEVVCATDAGREGELIFRLVYEQAGCSKPMKRLWISSMEESAIREGFENLKPGSDYDHLYHSALCRQEADWLVGINGTRLFTVLYGGKVLKVGRVQTPTLAMLVERESKIMNFKKEQYFMAHILCGGVDAAVCGGDVVVATAAVRQEGTSREYLPLEYPAAASYPVVHALANACEALGYRTHVGVVQSKDSFYGEIRPQCQPIAADLKEKWTAWTAAGVLASEMEAAALFTAGAALHVRVGAVLNVLWNDDSEQPDVPEGAAARGIQAAVSALCMLIEQDKRKA